MTPNTCFLVSFTTSLIINCNCKIFTISNVIPLNYFKFSHLYLSCLHCCMLTLNVFNSGKHVWNLIFIVFLELIINHFCIKYHVIRLLTNELNCGLKCKDKNLISKALFYFLFEPFRWNALATT